MQKVTPFLMFNDRAEEAMNLYASVFKNSAVVSVRRRGESGPGIPGTVTSGTFEIDGQQFYVLNGGPAVSFTPAISFFVRCESQEEVDHLWENLSVGGAQMQCGWIRDKFGVSWQIIPSVLGELLDDPDADRAGRVWKAMLQMHKLDIQKLKDAAANG
jgi:predicted 3-demethylubiquinone-9 3-methyltransferase (glyoxalase superfamily)